MDDNRWYGYSERGLIGAWLHDLSKHQDVPAALLEFLQTGGCPDPPAEALRRSHALTTVVEPGFAGFGNPDGLIVAEARDGASRRATALILVEAKRGPLAAEWEDRFSADGGWNPSHLVVQTARGIAFLGELRRHTPGPGASGS